MDELSEKIRSCEGLIYKIIKDHFPQLAGDEDAIQIGRIAIWKALNCYDSTRKVSFTSYACKLIRNALSSEAKRRAVFHSNVCEEVPEMLEVEDRSALEAVNALLDDSMLQKVERQLSNSAKEVWVLLKLGYSRNKICQCLMRHINKDMREIKETILKEIAR